MAPTGTPVSCSACWQSRATSWGVPLTPKTSAKATVSAALEERPDPAGRSASMRTVPPAGRTRATSAATGRAHAGSSDRRVSVSAARSTGSLAGGPNPVDATTSSPAPVGAYSTVTPSPMAMGRATPWL